MSEYHKRMSEQILDGEEASLSARARRSSVVRERLVEDEQLITRAHLTNLGVNAALLLVKLLVAHLSGSMAVLASFVDSVVDLVAQGVLYAASRLARQSPRAGRGNYGPLGVFTCAVLMGLAALSVVWVSLVRLGEMVSGSYVEIEWSQAATYLMVITVLARLVVAFGCRHVVDRTGDVTIAALGQDSLNDVMSNAAALLAAWATQLGPSFALSDPLGAILISLLIIRNWAQTGLEQVEVITGREADPELLDKVSAAASKLAQVVLLDNV
ncbi:hypothetical protein T492DRAFT_407315 [Pavlovales sp. CCMP2436]|nr:hypothetical protein T492DRAFT_407315 [Pavlovales sp. CCMP2436]